MAWVQTVNTRVATSPVGRYFRLEGSGHARQRQGARFLTEMRAGLVAFFAMAYIIAVNPSIVADSGGPCVCDGGAQDPVCNNDAAYALCTAEVKRDMVTATAAISALASFCMGLFANLPVSLAPGMGLNAYFAYNVVGFHGSGSVPYAVAVTAIFVEGWIFAGLALLGLRQWLARLMPRSIKLATGAGIGLFLTLIGLTYSEGLGLVVGGRDTPLELAGCLRPGADGLCADMDKMRSPRLWLGIFCGGILTVLLMLYRVRGAILAGIILVSVVSWPRTTPFSYFPHDAAGDDAFAFFRRGVDFHPIGKTLLAQRWDVSGHGAQFGLALVTFLYTDILDCTGTLYSMARFAGLADPASEDDFEGSSVAFIVDAVAISVGALLGTPPVTAFVESGAGISDGGRTGLTAMTTGLCFLLSIFLAPIFASIPGWATGCVLVIVGAMMMKAVVDINWRYLGDAIPAFVTIMLMPFSYSIAYGLIGGVACYVVINTVVWLVELASGGRIVPHNKHERDPWSWRVSGGVLPPWLRRLTAGKRDFWRPHRLPRPDAHDSGGSRVDHGESSIEVNAPPTEKADVGILPPR